MKYNLGWIQSDNKVNPNRYPGNSNYFGAWKDFHKRYISDLKNICKAKILNFHYMQSQTWANGHKKQLRILIEE